MIFLQWMETHHPDSSQPVEISECFFFLSNLFVFPQKSAVLGSSHLCLKVSAFADNLHQMVPPTGRRSLYSGFSF